MHFRQNPLKDPIKAIHEIIDYFQEKINEHSKSFKGDISRFYEEEDPNSNQLQYSVRSLGRWKAYSDIKNYLLELIEIIEEDSDLVYDALVALYDRETKFIIEPIISLVHQRFIEAQEEMGISYEDITFSDIRYGDQFVYPVDVFVSYYLYDFTFSMLLYSLEKLIAASLSEDPVEFIGKTLMLVNQRHEKMAAEMSDEQLANIVDDINSLISGRTYYGLRSNAVNSLDFTKLYWSNGARRWLIGAGTYDQALVQKLIYKKELSYRLDANEIIVPYPPAIVELILSSLYPLPLYFSSLEGKAELRNKGKQGPLVSDRTAKNIIISATVMYIRAERIENYGLKSVEEMEAKHGPLTPNDWYVKNVANNVWDNLLKAKAEQDDAEFEEILNRLGIQSIGGFYGQLKNWFEGRQL